MALWHTEGRRQPSLIGKDPAGKPLWGGPYTTYQAAAIVGTLLLLWPTRGLWGAGQKMVAQLVITVAAAAGASVLAGRIDYTQVAPVWNVVGWITTQLQWLLSPRGRNRSSGRTIPKLAVRSHRGPGTWVLDLSSAAADRVDDTEVTSDTESTHTESTDITEVLGAIGVTAPIPESHPVVIDAPARDADELAPDGPRVRRSGLEAFLAAAGSTPSKG